MAWDVTTKSGGIWILFLPTIQKPSSMRRYSQNLRQAPGFETITEMEGVTVTVQPWILAVVALVDVLTTTPGLATSFCGDRLTSRGPLGGGLC
jgi:hypothetical protein